MQINKNEEEKNSSKISAQEDIKASLNQKAGEERPLSYNKGDIVKMAKAHACGGDEFLIQRKGVDIKLSCLKCQHSIWLKRRIFEKKIKRIKNQEGKFIKFQK